MESLQQFTGTKLFVKLSWALAGLSITSCLIRNDYNVLFSFLILVIINRFYSENSKLYGKILIHLLIVLVLVDILWLIIIMPFWNTSAPKNAYWESLSTIHSLVLTLAFIELFLKAGLAGLFFLEFRKSHPNDTEDLFKFSYTAPLNSK